MNRYRVMVTMDHEELTAFLAKGVAGKFEVEILPGELADVVHQLHPKPRAHRGSKVNEAILGALAGGPLGNKELKEALQKAGLAAGSLAGGVAQLLAGNRIQRGPNGSFVLTALKAAE